MTRRPDKLNAGRAPGQTSGDEPFGVSSPVRLRPALVVFIPVVPGQSPFGRCCAFSADTFWFPYQGNRTKSAGFVGLDLFPAAFLVCVGLHTSGVGQTPELYLQGRANVRQDGEKTTPPDGPALGARCRARRRGFSRSGRRAWRPRALSREVGSPNIAGFGSTIAGTGRRLGRGPQADEASEAPGRTPRPATACAAPPALKRSPTVGLPQSPNRLSSSGGAGLWHWLAPTLC